VQEEHECFDGKQLFAVTEVAHSDKKVQTREKRLINGSIV